jgi:hypothetical protein
MPAIEVSRCPFGPSIWIAPFACDQTLFHLRPVCAFDHGHHRAVDYTTRRSTELTEAIETASRAAFNVERVNSLVYAVVMESRGI